MDQSCRPSRYTPIPKAVVELDLPSISSFLLRGRDASHAPQSKDEVAASYVQTPEPDLLRQLPPGCATCWKLGLSGLLGEGASNCPTNNMPTHSFHAHKVYLLTPFIFLCRVACFPCYSVCYSEKPRLKENEEIIFFVPSIERRQRSPNPWTCVWI